MRPFRTSRLLMPAALLAATLLSACVYKLDTQQGNLLDAEQVDAVEVGMTRSQVRFLLGTPMVADPFSLDRWDYMYYFRAGKGGDTRRSHVVVFFDGDTVSQIQRPESLQKGRTSLTGAEKAVDEAKEQAEKQARDPEA
jgi:outer membrane protein assembly factor BamE